MYKMYIITILLCIWIVNCSTSYQQSGFSGGYDSVQLSEDVFEISFRGNAFTSSKKVQDFALMRAAEVASQNGYDYFRIVGEEDKKSDMYIQTKPDVERRGKVSKYGNDYYYTEEETYNRPTKFSKSSNTLTIQCFKEKVDGLVLYNSMIVIQNLQDKYDMGLPYSD